MFPVVKIAAFLVMVNARYGHGAVKEAFFQRQQSQYLPNSVIITKHTSSELECSVHCTRLEACLSVNYKIGGAEKGSCELNNSTVSEKHGVDDAHFVYLGIAVWSRKKPQKVEGTFSCKATLDENANLSDGIYHLQVEGSSESYPVYCHMTEISGCGSGGWTLVMKTDGAKTTFNYNSPYWSNKETYAVEDGLEGLTYKESKLASYWNTPFKKICLGMMVTGFRKWMMLDYEASSLYSLIADRQYRNTTAGRTVWRSMIAGSSLQPKCNKEGFGLYYPREIEMRLGLMANNHDGCGQSDSCIGFGITYGSCRSSVTTNISCGNIAQCSSNDRGKKLTPAFGYILVQ